MQAKSANFEITFEGVEGLHGFVTAEDRKRQALRSLQILEQIYRELSLDLFGGRRVDDRIHVTIRREAVTSNRPGMRALAHSVGGAFTIRPGASGPTVYHEMTHALHSMFVRGANQLWFSEGLATMAESLDLPWRGRVNRCVSSSGGGFPVVFVALNNFAYFFGRNS